MPKKKSLRPLFALVLAFLTLALTGCGMHGWGKSGKIIDASTGKPLPGVTVVALWEGDKTSLVDSQTICLYARTTTTDSKGRYKIWGWFGLPHLLLVSGPQLSLRAYKRGYGPIPHVPESEKLRPYTGSQAERLQYLRGLSRSTGCFEAGYARKNLLPFVKAVYAEARGLAKTSEGLGLIESLRFRADDIQYGYNAAQKRQIERSGGGLMGSE